MTRQITRSRIGIAILGLVSLVGLAAATGCDDYVYAGDFYEPSVAPMDFSPYGYDYDMYDLFTSDI